MLPNSEPKITGIDLTIAKTLFDNNVLFIDARAENFNDGHIPNALCNDDFDLLVEQLDKLIELDERFVVCVVTVIVVLVKIYHMNSNPLDTIIFYYLKVVGRMGRCRFSPG